MNGTTKKKKRDGNRRPVVTILKWGTIIVLGLFLLYSAWSIISFALLLRISEDVMDHNAANYGAAHSLVTMIGYDADYPDNGSKLADAILRYCPGGQLPGCRAEFIPNYWVLSETQPIIDNWHPFVIRAVFVDSRGDVHHLCFEVTVEGYSRENLAMAESFTVYDDDDCLDMSPYTMVYRLSS